MAELKFVGKCFLITLALIFCLQFEVQGTPIEQHVTSYLRKGTTMVWLRESMKGAHLFVMNSTVELAPKLNMSHWFSKIESKVEPLRNISTDTPTVNFPEDAVDEDNEQKASVF
jgi:hypothetical protein